MPSVPRRSPDQVQVQGLPSARVSTEAPAGAFGGGPAAEAAGQAGQQLTRAFGDIILAEKRKADEAAVVDLDAKATKLENELLYHPELGALNKQRKDAVDAYGKTLEAYQKGSEELLKSAANEAQRVAIKQMLDKRGLAIERTLSTHVAGETRKISIEAGETNAQNAHELAVAARNTQASPDEPEPIIENIRQGRAALTISLENAGVEKDVINRRIAEYTSNTAVSVANAHLVDNQPERAEEFLKKYDHLLTEKDRAAIVPRVREKVFENRVIEQAEVSIAQAGVKEDGTVKVEDAIARTLEASKDLSPIEKDKAVQTTVAKARILDARTAERKNTQLQTFYARAIDGEKKGAPPDILRHSLEPLYAGMSEPEKRQMNEFLVTLHTNRDKAFSDAISSSVDKQAAWKQVESIVYQKYDKSQTMTDPETGAEIGMRDYVLSTLRRDTASMPAKDWKGYAANQLKDVELPPTWWLERVFPSKELALEQTRKKREAAEKGMAWRTTRSGELVRVRKLPDGTYEEVTQP